MGAWDDLGIESNDGPKYWNPQEPEKIRGIVTELGRYTDDEDKVHPQVVLDVDGEEVTVTAFRKILAQELNDLDDLKVGSDLEIDFQGKAKGKRYYVYRTKIYGEAPKRATKGAEEKEEF